MVSQHAAMLEAGVEGHREEEKGMHRINFLVAEE